MTKEDLDLDSEGGTPNRKYSCPQEVTCLRHLQTVFTTVCAILLLALVVLTLRSDKTVARTHEKLLPCTSQSCIATSHWIQSSMNTSVDPCEDMYEYACGGWLESISLPEGAFRFSKVDEVHWKNSEILRKLMSSNKTTLGGKESTAVRKLKTYYNACMDKTTIENQGTTKILQIINNLGSWPVSREGLSAWDRGNWTLQSSLEQIHKLVRKPLFTWHVSTDFEDMSKYIVTFRESGLTLPGPSYYNSSYPEYRDAFVFFAAKIGSLLGSDHLEAVTKMGLVFEFENKLAKIFVSDEQLNNPNETYVNMSLGQFQVLIGPWMNVRKYLNAYFKGRLIFTQRDQIIVKSRDYFRKLGHLIKGTDKEVIANYMMWHVVHSFIEYLPASFTDALLDFTSVLTGVTSLPVRWEYCLRKAKDLMGDTSGALYVNENFPAESKRRVEKIAKEIRWAFITNLDTHYLDNESNTYSGLMDKAQSVSFKVGYPDWILNVDELDKIYAKLTVEPGQFLGNELSRIKYANDEELDVYSRKINRFEMFGFKVVDANAFYNPLTNKVYVLAGLMQPPIFHPNYPDAFMYGTVGTTIGHEMIHGFDPDWRHLNRHGNMSNIWTESEEKEFVSRAGCFVDFYGNYSMFGHKINGTLTLAENIADNGGLRTAYNAFKIRKRNPSNLPGLDLTDEQLFFLGFSQQFCEYVTPEEAKALVEIGPHSFGKPRVHGALSNNEDFAKAFNCASGTPLNPREKCRLW